MMKPVIKEQKMYIPSKNLGDIDLEVVNVVASVTLDQRIDLLEVMEVFRNVAYNPKQFPGLVFRLKKPKTATLIFNSGKMVCTGAKSENEARNAVMKVVDELINNGIISRSTPMIEIQNMVASGNLHGSIDLETAADILDDLMYEPEQFPGLIYRLPDPKTVILLFASGKLVCTGAKSEAMAHESVSKVRAILEDYELIISNLTS